MELLDQCVSNVGRARSRLSKLTHEDLLDVAATLLAERAMTRSLVEAGRPITASAVQGARAVMQGMGDDVLDRLVDPRWARPFK